MTKVCSLPDAIDASVHDGTHLALCGFAITRNAVAGARQVVTAGRRDLELTQVIAGLETDVLVAGGCVRQLSFSGGSLDRFGSLASVNRAIAEERLEVEELSTLALTMRLHAGGLGLPFIPARSMLGSGLLDALIERGTAKVISDPFTGTSTLVLVAVRPDVAIVHVDAADTDGNATISGPVWAIRETVFASKAVVMTCEQVVERGTIPPQEVVIPGAVVTSVVHAPRGAHPTAVYEHYDYDAEQLRGYVEASRAGDEAAINFLDENVPDENIVVGSAR